MSAVGRTQDRAEWGRKAIHLGAIALPVAWGQSWLTTGQVRGILAALALAAVLVEAARRWIPAAQAWFVAWFGAMLRPHERTALTGATWGALTMLATVWVVPTRSAQVAMWAIVVGDGLASVAGRAWQRRVPASGSRKTHAGSLVVLVATAIGARWFGAATWPAALAIGAATALAERPVGPLDDNIRVPTAAALAAWALGVG